MRKTGGGPLVISVVLFGQKSEKLARCSGFVGQGRRLRRLRFCSRLVRPGSLRRSWGDGTEQPHPTERPPPAAGGDARRARELPDRRRAHARRALLLDRLDRPRPQRHPHRLGRTEKVVQTRPHAGRLGRHRDGPGHAHRLRLRGRGLRRRPRRPAAAGLPRPARATSSTSSLRPRRVAPASDRLIPVPPPCRRAAAADLPAHRHDADGLAASASRSRPTARRCWCRSTSPTRRRSSTSPSGAVRYVATGSYPYGAAITPDGRTGLVSNEADRHRFGHRLAPATKVGQVGLAPLASRGDRHRPRRQRAPTSRWRTSDRVAVIDLRRTRTLRQATSVDGAGRRAPGTTPSPLALTPDGAPPARGRSGRDELACSAGRRLAGRPDPAAAYPTACGGQPAGSQLVVDIRPGPRRRAEPERPRPEVPDSTATTITNSFQYLPSSCAATPGICDFPSDTQIRA